MISPQISVNNYLVPATGTTHGYPVKGTFTGDPYEIDFRVVELDGYKFVPSGVFIDNTQGVGPLTVKVLGIDYNIVCPAGSSLQNQYPAPSDQQVEITGNGDATVIFVDFPVLPWSPSAGGGGGGGGPVTVANGANVVEGNTADAAGANTIIGQLKLIANYASGLTDTDGNKLPANFDSLPQVLTYAGGNLSTIAKTGGGFTYTQTYTYTGSDLTGISGWVRT